MTDQVFGSPVDRQAEDQKIVNNPPAAVGNPRTSSLLDQLKAKFKGYDEERLGKIKLTARNGAPVWLELDLDIDEDTLKDYREKAKGNRASRRGKNKDQGDVSLVRVTARILSDRNTRIWFDDPAQGGATVNDPEGDPLTVHSDEWLEITGSSDPVQALRDLFGDWALINAGEDYLELAGIDGGSEIVNPTSGSSGD